MPVGNALLAAFLKVIYSILDCYVWILIIGAVLSWLVAFGVVNPYNRVVHTAGDFLTRITEPLLAPIRRVLPSIGGYDLSPVVLIFVIYFIQTFIRYLAI
jgi:YggT family protein